MRRTAGIERELASRADQRVLRWFAHVERIDEKELMSKKLSTVLTFVPCGPVCVGFAPKINN